MHTSVRRNAPVDIGIIYMPTKAVLSLRMFDMYVLPADLVFLTYVQLLTTVREKRKASSDIAFSMDQPRLLD